MRPFAYHRPADSKALKAIPVGPLQDVPPTSARAQFIVGGTTILDLMKLEVAQPEILIDITQFEDLSEIEARPAGLRLGALARLRRQCWDRPRSGINCRSCIRGYSRGFQRALPPRSLPPT